MELLVVIAFLAFVIAAAFAFRAGRWQNPVFWVAVGLAAWALAYLIGIPGPITIGD